MKSLFNDSGVWVLPKKGTIGGKAQNLFDNSGTILRDGFSVPRSLAIPFEYLLESGNPAEFVLDQIDFYFPDWLMMCVRSSAPDEDNNGRMPGLYISENLWKPDGDYALVLIDRVLRSYDNLAAKTRRLHLGFDEKGMGLLIQEPVTRTPGVFDAYTVGSFGNIGDRALLSIADPEDGMNAMNEKPLAQYRVGIDGKIAKATLSSQYAELAERLMSLAQNLTAIPEKGWEIEFAENNAGVHILQTTPVHKSGPIKIPNNIKSIFEPIAVLGTGEAETDGILYAPPLFNLDDLIKFDAANKNYCLVTTHSNIASNRPEENILNYLTNPKAIIDIKDGFFYGHPFAIHIQQYLREGRVALAGKFTDIFEEVLLEEWERGARLLDRSMRPLGLMYSPTRLVVIADEFKEFGLVGLADGKVYDFEPVGIRDRERLTKIISDIPPP
ncbi:MAG: hypothetical protein AABX51_04070 [Nanoarchaeota archaeon]